MGRNPHRDSPINVWEWLFCAIGLAGALLALGYLIVRDAPDAISGRRPEDFAHYYVAARRVLHGENPYPPVASEVESLLGYQNYEAPVADPPALLLTTSPLGLFSYRTAWLLFAASSTLIIVTSTIAVCRGLKLSWPIAIGTAGAAFMSRPFQQCLYYNHAEWLVLAVCVAGWWLVRQGNAKAGVFWGLAAAWKLFPGMLLVSLLFGRHYRIAWSVFFGGFVFTLLGIAAIGWEPTWEFITVTIPRSKYYYNWTGNSSLMGIGYMLTGHTSGGTILTAIGAAVIVAGLWLRPGGVDRAYAAGTTAALILSPLSWIFYGILAFPPLILLGTRCNWSSLLQRAAFIALAALVLVWPITAVGGLVDPQAKFLAITVPRMTAYCVLFAWSLWAID